MIEAMKAAWAERSPREQWMLGIMVGLFLVVILWLGVARPVDALRRTAHADLLEAVDRNAAIRIKVKELKALPPATASAGAATPLDQYVGQGAAEAGLTLDRAQAQGADRIDVAIASVRPVALFGWLSALEAQGIRVETISARPSPTAGSVSVNVVLVR